jgi:hypothetical protein
MRIKTSPKCQMLLAAAAAEQSPGQFPARGPAAFMGRHHAAFDQYQLDITQAESQDMVQPDSVTDDPGPGTGGRDKLLASPSVSQAPTAINLAMPLGHIGAGRIETDVALPDFQTMHGGRAHHIFRTYYVKRTVFSRFQVVRIDINRE